MSSKVEPEKVGQGMLMLAISLGSFSLGSYLQEQSWRSYNNRLVGDYQERPKAVNQSVSKSVALEQNRASALQDALSQCETNKALHCWQKGSPVAKSGSS